MPMFAPVSRHVVGVEILPGTTLFLHSPGFLLTWCSMHLWSLISSENVLLQMVMHAVPFFSYWDYIAFMKILFYFAFPVWRCCFSTPITITVCYPCHFKDLQWNDNPLFGVILNVIKLIPPCCCGCGSPNVIITVSQPHLCSYFLVKIFI